MSAIRNQRGQSLVEYLIIVALMAVAAIGVMRVVSQNTRAQFANIANALQGKEGSAKLQRVNEKSHQNKDLSDFFEGAANSE